MDGHDNNEIKQLQIWARSRQLATTELICRVINFIRRRRIRRRNYVDRSIMNSERQRVRDEIMYRLTTNENSRDVIRMGPQAFIRLCNILERDAGLLPTQRVSVEEQVGKFLHILGNNVRNRTIAFFFHRSGETISRQ